MGDSEMVSWGQIPHCFRHRSGEKTVNDNIETAAVPEPNHSSVPTSGGPPADRVFPYPLNPPADDPESRLLVDWIRNHSSFLTVGHLAAKLGRMAAFLGGTVGNWLFLVPWMLAASLVIGYLHFYFLDHWLRSWIALSLIIWWPVGKAFRLKERRSTRTQWNPTWTVTRRGGSLLLSSFIAAGIVAMPHVVETLRDWQRTGPIQAGAMLAIAMAVLRFAQGFVSQRRGVVMILLQIATALLGILFLAGMVTWLENYVVYGSPFRVLKLTSWRRVSLFNPMVVFGVGLALSATVLLWAKFKRYQIFQRSTPWLTWSIRWPLVSFLGVVFSWIALSFLLLGKVPWTNKEAECELDRARQQIGNLTLPISRMVAALDHAKAIPSEAEVKQKDWNPEDYEVRFGLSEGTIAILRQLSRQRRTMAGFYNAKPVGFDSSDEATQNRSIWSIEYFSDAQRLVDTAGELGDQSWAELAQLRSVLSEAYRSEWFDQLKRRSGNEPIDTEPLIDAAIAEAAYQVASDEIKRAKERQPDIKPAALLEILLSSRYQDVILADLKERTVNAYHQQEYERLVSKNEQKPTAPSRLGKTIASQGTISLVQDRGHAELQKSIQTQALNAMVDQSSPLKLDSPTLEKLFEGVSSDLIETEKERLRLNDMDIASLTDEARKLLGNETPLEQVRLALVIDLLLRSAFDDQDSARRNAALESISELSRPVVTGPDGASLQRYQQAPAALWPGSMLRRGMMARFGQPANRNSEVAAADDIVIAIMQGGKPLGELTTVRSDLMRVVFWPKVHLFLATGLLVLFLSFYADGNGNSMHGFYRNHLVNAFFVSRPEPDETETEEVADDEDADAERSKLPKIHPDFRLTDLCPPGSTAPYLLVNAALNLQGVDDPSLRDRVSDFFFFSKYFYGSERVGFARSELLHAAHPEMTLGSAMAISGAAVSPNMGRRTNGFLVMVLTLLNVRLGYWVPKPNVFRCKKAKGPRQSGRLKCSRCSILRLSMQCFPGGRPSMPTMPKVVLRTRTRTINRNETWLAWPFRAAGSDRPPLP